MTAWTHPRRSEDEPPMLSDDNPLSPAEVGALWAFLHGDIMIGGIRQQLRNALGLCPRHSWGYFVVEVELWLYGPEPRGGHIPFDVGVLYEDLLEHVSSKISSAHGTARHGLQQVVTPTAGCRICSDLTGPDDVNAPIGYAGSNAVELTAEAAELTFTTAWCVRTRQHWNEWICPRCQNPDAVPEEGIAAVTYCRAHLTDVPRMSSDDADTIVARLADIRRRMRTSMESMTQGGPAASDADDAAFVEALGWFASWQLPLAHSSGERG